MFGQGLEQHNNGDLEEAARIYGQALVLDPGIPDIYNNLGVALRALGKLEASAACYQRSLALNPDHAGSYTNLGNVLRGLGRLDAAAASSSFSFFLSSCITHGRERERHGANVRERE